MNFFEKTNAIIAFFGPTVQINIMITSNKRRKCSKIRLGTAIKKILKDDYEAFIIFFEKLYMVFSTWAVHPNIEYFLTLYSANELCVILAQKTSSYTTTKTKHKNSSLFQIIKGVVRATFMRTVDDNDKI